MLNIKTSPSTNQVDIVGILKELSLEEKTSTDGKKFVAGRATIKVDQDINGKAYECEIPVELYANELTSEGKPSKLYPIVVGYKEKLTSLAACPEDQPQLASKIVVTNADLVENVWWDQNANAPKTTYKIRSNFLNLYNGSQADYKEKATFELTGVVLKTEPEIMNDEETGRLKVSFGVVGYNGKVDKIVMIADQASAVEFINANWNQGDTVKVAGRIKFSHKVIRVEEKLGFGDPIINEKTISCREFIITSGSECGFKEEKSYDSSDIQRGLEERNERIAASKNRTPANKNQSAKNKFTEW